MAMAQRRQAQESRGGAPQEGGRFNEAGHSGVGHRDKTSYIFSTLMISAFAPCLASIWLRVMMSHSRAASFVVDTPEYVWYDMYGGRTPWRVSARSNGLDKLDALRTRGRSK